VSLATDSNHQALADLDRKLQLVRDRVKAVGGGFQTGLFLCGAGGLGKSFNVFQQLDALSANYRIFNSRMTGKGLFRALERAPDAVHVLEDMERLTHDRDAQGVLRSALWAQPSREREVTWTTAEGELRFAFHGGLMTNTVKTPMPMPMTMPMTMTMPAERKKFVRKLRVTANAP
jgi:hypothetical protein